jgi:hypothetical protein
MNPIEQLIEALQYTHKETYNDLYELVETVRQYEMNLNTDKVTRFEVIEHTEGGRGRFYTKHNIKVDLSFQDDSKTLKVFVSDK